MGLGGRYVWLVVLILPLLQEGGLERIPWAALGDTSSLGSLAAKDTRALGPRASHRGRRRPAGRSGFYSVNSDRGAAAESSADTGVAKASTPGGSHTKGTRRLFLHSSRSESTAESSEDGTASSLEDNGQRTSTGAGDAAGSSKAGKKKGRKALGSGLSKKKTSRNATLAEEDDSDAEAAIDASAVGQTGRSGEDAGAAQQAAATTAPGRKRSRRSLFKSRQGGSANTARDGPPRRRASGRLRLFKQSVSSSVPHGDGKEAAKRANKGDTLLMKEPKLTAKSSLDYEDGFPSVLPRPPHRGGTTPRHPLTGCMPVQATPGFESFATGLPHQGVGCRLRMQAGRHHQPSRQEHQQSHEVQHQLHQVQQEETQEQQEQADLPKLPQPQEQHEDQQQQVEQHGHQQGQQEQQQEQPQQPQEQQHQQDRQGEEQHPQQEQQGGRNH
ncbi:hypothetical protein, conserved [Eimeria acervulina]|uniref:Uncharacterized protein n=1 Tax=Eimeria acervulina TaxID=5801 RepID=U6GF62_EIMAC|nr:hypothetical protein, conserved [Eimeria acervulina]CDI78891.1 hypothetical protein, conserved [Eimeria acervulina]